MTSETIRTLDHEVVMHTYGRYPIALVRGEGVRAYDADGKAYLDFLGGIAVNLLGHAHPAVVAAIHEQAGMLIHCSNLYYTDPGARLAKKLVDHGGLGKVFFCNSGAEANEGAFKLARKFQFRKGEKARSRIVSLSHAFHGRTLACLAATPKPAIQEGFGPLPAAFETIEAGDKDALDRAIDSSLAALVIEPVQGEGGIVELDRAYLHMARELTRQRGALLIFDEIQCGLGRLGHHLFAYPSFGVTPDIVTLAKGLGGGLPLGAVCATSQVADLGFQPGDHATTFGANPVVCAAALATIETILSEHLLERVAVAGRRLRDALERIQERYPTAVRQVRGRGLMLGMELAIDANAVLGQCHQRGLLANVAASNVLRLLPPYIMTDDDIDEAAAILDASIQAIAQS